MAVLFVESVTAVRLGSYDKPTPSLALGAGI